MIKPNINIDREMWKKHGFYIHLNEKKNAKNQVDYHTHGILHSRGDSDFTITQPIDPELAKAIFIELVEKMDNSEIIRESMELYNVLGFINLKILKGKEENTLKLQTTNLPNNYLWKLQ